MGILLLSQHIELRECLDLIGTPGFGYLLKDRVLQRAPGSVGHPSQRRTGRQHVARIGGQ